MWILNNMTRTCSQSYKICRKELEIPKSGLPKYRNVQNNITSGVALLKMLIYF